MSSSPASFLLPLSPSFTSSCFLPLPSASPRFFFFDVTSLLFLSQRDDALVACLPFVAKCRETSFFVSRPQKKSVIATGLVAAVSLFVVAVHLAEKPYFPWQPAFSGHWAPSKQPYQAFKPHPGYVSIPKMEVSVFFPFSGL